MHSRKLTAGYPKWWALEKITPFKNGVIFGTLPETNIAPENRPLEKEIPIGNHHFEGYVSFRECIYVRFLGCIEVSFLFGDVALRVRDLSVPIVTAEPNVLSFRLILSEQKRLKPNLHDSKITKIWRIPTNLDLPKGAKWFLKGVN